MIKKYPLILSIFILCLISPIIITIEPIPKLCISGCDLVRSSNYSSFIGIRNSTLGIFIFSILSIITALQLRKKSKNKERIISLATIFGSLVALYFIYLQAFVLHAYCQYCLIVDISLILSLIINLFWREK